MLEVYRNVSSLSAANNIKFMRYFRSAAVDFAGPYLLKASGGRGIKTSKGYIASFFCMSTDAMHLELVSSLSSQDFLAAFRSLISRRGAIVDVYSDNGTNFVGANKEISLMVDQCLADLKVRHYFIDSRISWHFNPPSAPHMGGYWEAGIKRIKYHIKRALGNVLLTYEEFNTLLTEVEACVNSRPLVDHSSQPADVHPLTPGQMEDWS